MATISAVLIKSKPKAVVPNSYKDFPEVPYQKTSIDFKEFIKYAQSINEVNIFALAIIANESSWGVDGVNNNYGGIQADVGRWEYPKFGQIMVATSVTIDNTTTNRRFIVFRPDNPVKDNYDFILFKVKDKGINNIGDYFVKWVGLTTIATREQLTDFNGTIESVKKRILNLKK